MTLGAIEAIDRNRVTPAAIAVHVPRIASCHPGTPSSCCMELFAAGVHVSTCSHCCCRRRASEMAARRVRPQSEPFKSATAIAIACCSALALSLLLLLLSELDAAVAGPALKGASQAAHAARLTASCCRKLAEEYGPPLFSRVVADPIRCRRRTVRWCDCHRVRLAALQVWTRTHEYGTRHHLERESEREGGCLVSTWSGRALSCVRPNLSLRATAS